MKNGLLDLVYGINPVFELLKANRRRAKKVLLEKGKDSEKIKGILEITNKKGITVEWKDKKELDKLASSGNHQGIICHTTAIPLKESSTFLENSPEKNTPSIYIVLDRINDPMNFGAVIRSSVIAGIDGIVIPRHGSCPVTAAVAKASAGALEYAN